MASKMKHTMGERLNIRFNGKIKLEFHGARLTSDGEYLFLFRCEHKLFENGHIVFHKRPKVPGDNIGIFIAD